MATELQHYKKSDPHTIQALFNSIARRYDLTNSLMSFYLHSFWNQKLVNTVSEKLQGDSTTLLDLCAGTGDIAFRFPQKKNCTIHLLDFSREMLEVAKEKAKTYAHSFFFHEGDAQKLPFAPESFDAITLAYGIRNIQDPQKCLQECKRVLKKGSPLAILELTRPRNTLLRALHKLFLHTAIPLIGKLTTKNKEAYSYLKASIFSFIEPEELALMAKESGFRNTTICPLSGGIATLYIME